MNHQQIHDRRLELDAQSIAAMRRAQAEAVVAQADERTRLRAMCEAQGHIFTSTDSFLTVHRTAKCVACGLDASPVTRADLPFLDGRN